MDTYFGHWVILRVRKNSPTRSGTLLSSHEAFLRETKEKGIRLERRKKEHPTTKTELDPNFETYFFDDIQTVT
jgi:hypothetical protein